MRLRCLLLVMLLFSLLLAGCGIIRGGEQVAAQTPPQQEAPTNTSEPTVEPTAEPTTEPTAVPSPEPTAAVNNEDIASPTEVPPTPTKEPPAREASQPVRLEIPAIGLDMAPVAVALDEQRIPIVPKHDVGWYQLSAMPGQGENVVLWGHVLRWQDAPDIPAPFAQLHELAPGADIIVHTANGDTFRYQVSEAIEVTPDQVQYILPIGEERLTLVSCIGDNVIVDGNVTKPRRLVTMAKLVN